MVGFDIELRCEKKIIKVGGPVLVAFDMAEGREFWEFLAKGVDGYKKIPIGVQTTSFSG